MGMPMNACIVFLSVGRVTQLFGLSQVTAVSSVLTPALNARLLSFRKIVIPLIKSQRVQVQTLDGFHVAGGL